MSSEEFELPVDGDEDNAEIQRQIEQEIEQELKKQDSAIASHRDPNSAVEQQDPANVAHIPPAKDDDETVAIEAEVARRLADAKHKHDQAEAARLQQEAEAERLREAAEAARQQQEAEAERLREAARLQQEAEAERLREAAEAARQQQEAEAERLREAAEAARQQQEAEAALIRQQAEAERLRQAAEAERLRQAAEAAEQQRAIEAAVAKRLEEENKKREEELAVEREVARRLAAQKAKEEEEKRRRMEEEIQKRLQEANAAAAAAAEQQARIDAAVAERLKKAKEEAEEKRRQRDLEAEIERRVAAALANAEAEEKRKQMEEEVERRILAATEAKNKIRLQQQQQEQREPDEVDKPKSGLSRTPPPEKAVGVKQKDDDDVAESESESEESTSSEHSTEQETRDEEDVSSSGADMETASNTSATFLPIQVTTNNGMFAVLTSEELSSDVIVGSSDGEMPYSVTAAPPHATFEAALAQELRSRGLAMEDVRKDRVTIQQYETIREHGRCIAPSNETPNPCSHAAVQLGFFANKQSVISYNSNSKSSVAEREAPATELRHPRFVDNTDVSKPVKNLSQSKFYFEADVIKNPSVTADVDDDEDHAHNGIDECTVTVSEVTTDPIKAVEVATSLYSCGDLIQVYERCRGRRFEAAPKSTTPNAGIQTTTTGPTSGRLWVNDIETRKPIPTVPAFNGGALLKIDVKKLCSQVETIHGEATDPLFFSAALYCIHSTQVVNITDTFYFENGAFNFLPHRQPAPCNAHRSFVAFVPNEFRSVPTYLCVRVFRLATEDFDTFVDLYSRPDRYKQQHVVPMKQDTQQLAMQSDVLEELGWAHFSLYDGGKAVFGKVKGDKLFRTGKPTSEGDLTRLVMDTRTRNSLRTVNMEMEFEITDVTNYEFSFPDSNPKQEPAINESILEILNPDVPNAKKQTVRFVPCCLPILSSGHFHSYHNVMYLRMQSLKLANLTSVKYPSSTHWSFVVQVSLKDNDDDLSSEGSRSIYAHALGDDYLQTSAFTSTFHNAKEFDMADEFKIQLPLNLTAKHHIFFTVYAVSFKKPSPTSKDPRFFKIGYAVLPVLTKEFGSLFVKDACDLQVVSADHAAVCNSGYLEKFPTMPNTNMFNIGTYALRVGCHHRSSVYASNTTVSEFFKSVPQSLNVITTDDHVLQSSGMLTALPTETASDGAHAVCLKKIGDLPLPEIMAFYPLLTSYTLAIIASPSSNVTVLTRLNALKVLTEFTTKVHSYELSSKSLVNRRSGSQIKGAPIPPSQTGCVRTCTVNLLYFHISNDVLYQQGKQEFKLYAAVAEVLTLMLESTTGTTSLGSKGDVQQLLLKISDLSWFYLDLILRSLYLAADARKKAQGTASGKKAAQQFASDMGPLFAVFQRMVKEILSKLAPIGGVAVVQRLAIFVRNLFHCTDKGNTLQLMEEMLTVLESQAICNNVQIAARTFADDDDVMMYLFPNRKSRSPCYLTALLVKYIAPHLVHQVRDIRLTSASLLYGVVCRVVNNKRVPSGDLALLALQLQTLLQYCAENWALYRSLTDPKATNANSSAPSSIADRRTLLALLLWVVFTTPSCELRRWTKTLSPKTLAGFMNIICDAQTAFRYNYGKDKFLPEQVKLPQDIAEHAPDWDARFSTLVTFVGVRVIANLTVDHQGTLAGVKESKPNAAVFPFFLLLESVLHFGNSYAALQSSAAVLHHVAMTLMPEIISRKGRMSSGMVLLTIRMMSSCSAHIRWISTATFLEISKYYYALCGSLSKLKHHTANALVAVAESKVRDLRLAGPLVEQQMRHLVQRARTMGEVALPEGSSARYEDDGGEPSGDAAMKYTFNAVPQFMSCDCTMKFPSYLTQGALKSKVEPAASRPSFCEDFTQMASVMLSLFHDVLKLQVDDSMKFKEAKGSAYREVFMNFLRQNTLKEALKWLARLHEAHKAAGDNAEAGLVLVFTAALGFRITEAFFALKGEGTKGTRMPAAVLTYVLWHDYVRVLPEVNALIPMENIFTMVSDMFVVPEDPVFTVEGQIKLMKEASEYLDKNAYYELSVKAVSVVDKYLMVRGDYRGSSVVHNAISTWANAIATNGHKRSNFKYFLLWARMEREVSSGELSLLKKRRKKHGSDSDSDEPAAPSSPLNQTAPSTLSKPIKMIYKLPPTADAAQFKMYAEQVVSSYFTSPPLLTFTDEMTATKPPLELSAELLSKPSKALRQQLKAPNRCLMTVVEVTPCFSHTSGSSRSLDRSHFLDRFEHVNRVGNQPTTKAGNGPLSRSQHVSTNLPKTTIDVMHQQLSVNVHYTERCFPSTTTAIPIAKSEEQILDPYQTAVETINVEIDMVETHPENSSLLTVLLRALSPMNVLPPGSYYKELVVAMNHNAGVMSSVREILKLLREKVGKCEEMEAAAKNPETYALVLKGLADVECALIDVPLPHDEDPLNTTSHDERIE